MSAGHDDMSSARQRMPVALKMPSSRANLDSPEWRMRSRWMRRFAGARSRWSPLTFERVGLERDGNFSIDFETSARGREYRAPNVRNAFALDPGTGRYRSIFTRS